MNLGQKYSLISLLLIRCRLSELRSSFFFASLIASSSIGNTISWSINFSRLCFSANLMSQNKPVSCAVAPVPNASSHTSSHFFVRSIGTLGFKPLCALLISKRRRRDLYSVMNSANGLSKLNFLSQILRCHQST